jgi:hypothetical protein
VSPQVELTRKWPVHLDLAFGSELVTQWHGLWDYLQQRGFFLCHLCFMNIGTSPSEPPRVCFLLVPSGSGAKHLHVTAGFRLAMWSWCQIFVDSVLSHLREFNGFQSPWYLSPPNEHFPSNKNIVCQIETPHEYLVVPQSRLPQLSYCLSIIHVLLSESNRLWPPRSHVLGHNNHHI